MSVEGGRKFRSDSSPVLGLSGWQVAGPQRSAQPSIHKNPRWPTFPQFFYEKVGLVSASFSSLYPAANTRLTLPCPNSPRLTASRSTFVPFIGTFRGAIPQNPLDLISFIFLRFSLDRDVTLWYYAFATFLTLFAVKHRGERRRATQRCGHSWFSQVTSHEPRVTMLQFCTFVFNPTG